MATYAELFDFFAGGQSNSVLNKVLVACYVAAEIISVEDAGTTNHTNRLAWAKEVFENPNQASQAMMRVLVATNRDLTVTAIINASDAAIQLAVNNAIDVFATTG